MIRENNGRPNGPELTQGENQVSTPPGFTQLQNISHLSKHHTSGGFAKPAAKKPHKNNLSSHVASPNVNISSQHRQHHHSRTNPNLMSPTVLFGSSGSPKQGQSFHPQKTHSHRAASAPISFFDPPSLSGGIESPKKRTEKTPRQQQQKHHSGERATPPTRLTPEIVYGSPNGNFAGSKFTEAPAPNMVPLPPASWLPQKSPAVPQGDQNATNALWAMLMQNSTASAQGVKVQVA